MHDVGVLALLRYECHYYYFGVSLFYRILCELDFVTGKVFALGNGRETPSWLRVNLNLKFKLAGRTASYLVLH